MKWRQNTRIFKNYNSRFFLVTKSINPIVVTSWTERKVETYESIGQICGLSILPCWYDVMQHLEFTRKFGVSNDNILNLKISVAFGELEERLAGVTVEQENIWDYVERNSSAKILKGDDVIISTVHWRSASLASLSAVSPQASGTSTWTWNVVLDEWILYLNTQ